MPRTHRIACLLTAGLLAWPSLAQSAAEPFTVDAAKSRLTIQVGKAGAFSFIAGHTHEVAGPIDSGTVDVDRDDLSRSRLRLVINAAALKVTGKGESSEDVPKVQHAMESDSVLDVARYPRIVFQSTSVTVKERRGQTLDLVIAGELTIRDASRPVSAVVQAELAHETLTATGRFSIKQTAFGIKPITVGGVVAVKDALDITFSITAQQR
jgi:polyisoprenoid-binding protein YceI